MTSKVRLGIVGLGEHALRAHVKHLIQDPRVEIVIGFDPNPAVQAAFEAMTPGARWTNDLEQVWQARLDGVFLCSPDRFHAEQLGKADAHGLHVFCEKPMAVSMDDLDQVTRTVNGMAKAGRVLATCHPRRLDPPFLWLKTRVDNGELAASIGTPRHFAFNFWYPKVTDTLEDLWKKQRSLLSDHFGHEIDALCFFFPTLVDVHAARVHDSHWLYEVHGRARADGNGDPMGFRFLGVRDSTGSTYDETLTIEGTRGAWVVNLSRGSLLRSPAGTMEAIPAIDYDVRFAAVNRNFVDAVLGVAPNYLAPNDLLRNNTLSVQLDQTGVGSWS